LEIEINSKILLSIGIGAGLLVGGGTILMELGNDPRLSYNAGTYAAVILCLSIIFIVVVPLIIWWREEHEE